MNPETPKRSRKCPDCAGKLERIRILDATEPGRPMGESSGHITLSYAAADARGSWFTRTVAKSGDVCG
jgi:hypothetical protein